MTAAADQKTNDKPSMRITYYGFGGRAGALRMAASIGGISYEDNFISFAEQKKDKADGKRRWSGPPELTVFDKDGAELITFAQSNACLRYIGQLAGSYPSNPLQRALVDEVLDSVEDVINMLRPSLFEQDPDKKKAMRVALMDPSKLPYWMAKFNNRLKENKARGCNNGFIVGDTLTIADLKLYCNLKGVISGNIDFISAADLIDPQPELAAFCKMISELDTIIAYAVKFKKYQADYKDKKITKFVSAGKGCYAAF